MELGTFGSCESSINFDSDNNIGSFFPSVLLGNKKIMATSNTELKDIREVESHYTT